MTKKLVIGYFYPHLLNLYGDTGNVEILVARAKARNIDVEVLAITPDVLLEPEMCGAVNLVFMGGGPDVSQKKMYEDLIHHKGDFLRDYIVAGGVGLYICGSYQLLGHYYKSSDGDVLEGLGIFDLYTEHFGPRKPRCIGNVVAELLGDLSNGFAFSTLVGFENHGGRTFLGSTAQPFGKIKMGYGNNGQDGTEGVLYKNSIGTYLHGPLLAKNPHIADYLIAKSLELTKLASLDDSLILSAHTASKNLKQ